ncbi:MAG: bifunctional glutamate N-acetyltransferase/amino-acid acetyltransferase ArgJ [Rhodospirillaceae bacterium]|jgi:glutamate N-acetyltransferase/amino-acid N-acetyltransferase
MAKTSPLAPKRFPKIPAIAGVKLATAAAGLRYRQRLDVMLVETAPGTTVAGTLTKSQTASAPVQWCRKALKGGVARGLVVNSGNANVFTGKAGERAVAKTVQSAAALLQCPKSQVYVCSTGVIGEDLPVQKILDGLPGMQSALKAGNWENGARAIMTTDTFPKGCVRTATIAGKNVNIAGIAKGSGMIAPNMATMLAYVFTDAKIPSRVLQALTRASVDQSFNSITVDSDTSTSDTVLMFATGKADHKKVTAVSNAHLKNFCKVLNEVMIDLAHQIVKDGEGASKFISVTVTGAASDAAARRIGLTVANSPLVKTAIAGEDANWGRLIMAVGKAPDRVNQKKLKIKIGGVLIANGQGAVKGYDERPVAKHLKGQNVDIAIDVGAGKGKATVWTCDLTHEYISINADYRS